MPIGPVVRRMFGPYERNVADAYRAIFGDLDAMVDTFCEWAPDPRHILEVGCGEGAITERMCVRCPQAEILAIDVTPRVGRMFVGDASRVTFRQARIQDIAKTHPAAFDLVILCDVLHHVPLGERAGLLQAIRTTLAPGGRFIFKEWVKTATPIHWACDASDRYITGDNVSYVTVEEARAHIKRHFGETAIRDERTVRPWRNNNLMLVQAAA